MNKFFWPMGRAGKARGKLAQNDLHATSSPLVYRTLESRIAFDGAAAATVAEAAAASDADAAQSQGDAESAQTDSNSEHNALAVAISDVGSKDKVEIVFVDGSVDNIEEIISSINPEAEVVLLNEHSDGGEQIALTLEGRSNIDAIHIISHGDQGRLFLGNDTLDATSMQGEHADELAIIGKSLAEGGDILIYGCDFAGGGDGLEAAMLLGSITGADIAASDDVTGHEDLGGDWDLEEKLGTIEARTIHSTDWQGLLNNTVDTGEWETTTSGNDTSATSNAGGITTTVTLTSESANSSFTSFSTPTTGTMNNISAFAPAVGGQDSLDFTFVWDTSPERATSEATTDSSTGLITITFSQAVTNPIIHLDRIGGSDGQVHNASSLTLLTSGATLTRLSGTSHFSVNSTTGVITNSLVDTAIGTGYSGESSMTTSQGTASGSVQINGTHTFITFQIKAAPGANEGASADGRGQRQLLFRQWIWRHGLVRKLAGNIRFIGREFHVWNVGAAGS